MKRWTATICVIAGLSTLGATGCLETGQIDDLIAIARDAVDAAGELGLGDPNMAPGGSEGGYAADPNASGYGDSSYGDPNSGYSDPNSGDWGASEWPADPNTGWFWGDDSPASHDDGATPADDSHGDGADHSSGDDSSNSRTGRNVKK